MFNSVKPRTQRKQRYTAPLSARKAMMHVHLSKDLRAKLGITRRSMQIRKGDKVRLRVGTDAGKVGNVMRADYHRLRLYIEGFVNKTARGVEKLKPIQPANVEIIDGDFANKDRAEIIARGKRTTKASSQKTNTPSAPAQMTAPASGAAPNAKTN